MMRRERNIIEEKIEVVRDELHKAILCKEDSNKILRLSQRLDRLLNVYDKLSC